MILGKPKCFGCNDSFLCGHNREVLVCDFHNECKIYTNRKVENFTCKECKDYREDESPFSCECCNKKVCSDCIKKSPKGEWLCVECFEWKYY